MKIHLADDMAYLWGDWTAAEMSYRNIDLLSGLLDQIESRGRKTLEIDCAHLNSIDASGAHYLYIWLNCLQLRGIDYELVNIAGESEKTPLLSEHHDQSTLHNPFEHKYLTSISSRRRRTDETRRNKSNCQTA